ncbi:MAG: V-type ATP synthase subunit D [Candidatus Cloacimonadales bacterium]|jgi:V/A-type H+-transporting ATPase subunit D|nr:V-type ATP synthase subunit D [Candidatus Cloacimonadota bacterium]MDY0380443.1 V-type ATP synthase subunit D [Candidatus Cloacimonadaceae bacterium]MCB5257306.1 V-type ATP synthase subunit D [Candidatus Cloacimonadota bacterium]MCB5263436.1 V-type ATP synthase subunit D [Candidatus Cloacimonadota bacterium]MCB5276113.1 V-type ATP synthase subunit D [Candidatus Cloacimonadota bacterium]
MNLKFQYNKISQLQLIKQLGVRQKALPTLKNKESALRVEVKKARDKASELDENIRQRTQELDVFMKLWSEFDPDLISVKDVQIKTRKIAGVKTPLLEDISYHIKDFNLFTAPSWYLDGLVLLKELSRLQIEREFFLRKMHILEQVRKKTTQKVNLYEKVQIPAFEESILKIKRFLEDEENLSKAAQKILKDRLEELT